MGARVRVRDDNRADACPSAIIHSSCFVSICAPSEIRLREIKQAETRKYQREEARNMLEAFIYRVRDLLEDAGFTEASLEHERKLIGDKAADANEWLWDQADQATTKELKAKRTEIECVNSCFVPLAWTRALTHARAQEIGQSDYDSYDGSDCSTAIGLVPHFGHLIRYLLRRVGASKRHSRAQIWSSRPIHFGRAGQVEELGGRDEELDERFG